jgi:hypothetical protein
VGFVESQEHIRERLRHGGSLEDVEKEIIDPSPLSEERKAALWLCARSETPARRESADRAVSTKPHRRTPPSTARSKAETRWGITSAPRRDSSRIGARIRQATLPVVLPIWLLSAIAEDTAGGALPWARHEADRVLARLERTVTSRSASAYRLIGRALVVHSSDK